MRTVCTFIVLSTLASAGPERSGRIRYRDGALESALAEAKPDGRLLLVVLAMDG